MSIPIAKRSALSLRHLLPAFAGRYARRYLWIYVFGVLMLIATNALNVAIPRMIKEVFDELAGAQEITRIHVWIGLISLAAVVVIGVRTLSRVLFFNPGRTIEFRMRNDMLSRLLAMSETYFRGQSVGDLVSRATNDVTHVQVLVGFAALMLLNLTLAAGFSIWQMLQTNAALTLYCVLPLVGSVIVLRMGIKRLFGFMRASRVELGKLSAHVLQTLSGIAVVQGSVAEQIFEQKFEVHNARFTHLSLRITVFRAFLMPLAPAVGQFCVFLLLIVGGQHAIEGKMSVGDMAAYASYVLMLSGSLRVAGWLLNSLQRGYVSLQRCWEVLELQRDRITGQKELSDEGAGLRIELRELSFCYPDAKEDEPPTLKGISLTLAPGQVLGIYGEVGSGKTTLVELIAGLLSAPAGTVWIDGQELGTLRDASLRAVTAMVPQAAFLFSRSLRENVGFVDSIAEISDERVWQAMDKAALGDEVRRFPRGLDTVVGERGLTLSGGQRQRAQLARALYRPARLLLLDDVLSAVDHHTERRLLQTIDNELGAGAEAPTAVIVSSRVSALMGADQIIVLRDGEIVQRGDHDSLLAQGGLYAQAWQTQRQRDDVGPT